MIVFAKIEKPEDIYVFGSYIDHNLLSDEDDQNKFGITDDEATLTLRNWKVESSLTTQGFAYVFVKEQLLKYIDEFEEHDLEFGECIILKNYSGEIRLKVITEINNKEVDILEIFHPDEYLMYQPEMRNKLKEIEKNDDRSPMEFILEFDANMPKVLTMKEVVETIKKENGIS